MTIDRLAYISILFLAVNVCAQSNEPSDKWKKEILSNNAISEREYKSIAEKYDFGPLWTRPDNGHVYGFIGDNYERLRIKIISAAKDKHRPDTYFVSGRSKVKGIIRSFSGTIKITETRIYKKMRWGLDDEYKNKGLKNQGVIVGEYLFAEDRTKEHTGMFKGVMYTSWYIDRNNRLKYDDIEIYSDSYHNNQFVGSWTSYNSKAVKTCNWGDYRIPNSGDLDGGAGEFSPIDKYLNYGWQSYQDAFIQNSEPARREEDKRW